MNRAFHFLSARLLRLCLATIGVCLLLPNAASAADGKASGLAGVDWLIIGAYVSATIGLGWYFSRRQTTSKEYFTGSGNMNWMLIGVSLFATLLSTISYLSMPGESLGKGPAVFSNMLAFPLVFFIVGYGLLPVYMKHRVTSAYELLEVRLGVGIRLLGATLFLLLRLVWMSLLVFLTAKAMVVMMGVDEAWIPYIVLATGSVAVIYTSLGGLNAVVITDFVQTVLLYGGALLVLGVITFQQGGFGWFPTEWQSHWDTQPVFSTDPATRVTIVGSMLSFLVWYVCTSGGDQVSVQRFMATSDAKAARRALGAQLVVSAIVMLTLGLVGFALISYWRDNPAAFPSEMTLKSNQDLIFPHFIGYHLPIGVSGLVVSAMFAAAMSSIDSGVNSITAVVMTDYLDRFGRAPSSEQKRIVFARALAFTIGGIVVFGSTFMQYVPGNITEVTQKTSNLFTTPIFGLFFFALFVPFAKPVGVWVGAILGTLTAALIAFSGPIVLFLHNVYGVDPATLNSSLKLDEKTGEVIGAVDPISFQWIAAGSLLVNIVSGCLVSWLWPRSAGRVDGGE